MDEMVSIAATTVDEDGDTVMARIELTVQATRLTDLALLCPWEARSLRVSVPGYGGRRTAPERSEPGYVSRSRYGLRMWGHRGDELTVQIVGLPKRFLEGNAPLLAIVLFDRVRGNEAMVLVHADEHHWVTRPIMRRMFEGLGRAGSPVRVEQFGFPRNYTGVHFVLFPFRAGSLADRPRGLPDRRAVEFETGALVGLPAPERPADLSIPDRRAEEVEAVVSTGFAQDAIGARSIDKRKALEPGCSYLFWLQIGPLHPDAIDEDAQALPRLLRSGDRLTVTLTGVSEGVQVDAPGEVAACLVTDGAIPETRPDPALGLPATDRRLLIRVRTPPWPGRALWRCLIYWRGAVVQSRLIRAVVAAAGEPQDQGLSAELEYSIADPSEPASLRALSRHQASFFVGASSGGTHALTVRADAHAGAEPLHAVLSLDEGTITAAIQRARAALRTVAWGNAQPWDQQQDTPRYRHAERASVEQLTADMSGLAVAGYRLYQALLQELAHATGQDLYATRDLLAQALQSGSPVSGRDLGRCIQVAPLRSARHVFPAALLYDLPLDTNAPEIRLCQDYKFDYAIWPEQAISSRCLDGKCVQANDPQPTVVCPGGFWGFRHSVGVPLPPGAGRTAVSHLQVDGSMHLGAVLYEGFSSTRRHREALARLRSDLDVTTACQRPEVESMLTSSPSPHLIYFYCHAGLTPGGTPFLRFGDAVSDDDVLTPDNLFAWNVRWDRERPLVFLNGCETAGLEPEQLLDFASSFVTDAGASGFIGTEITVFEQMAAEFAEEYLHLFLNGHPAGRAVLLARHRLLSRGNPLGLAYVPFLLPNLTAV